MAAWSQSAFLQALGWATLNSFWQMAILWCLYVGANQFLKLSASKKYQASVLAMLLGFVWFLSTFLLYYSNSTTSYAFFENTIPHSNSLLNICLISASISYLLLLVFPAVRLIRNWQFVQLIKKEELQKADLSYRLFVQNVVGHLGISKKVRVVVSKLVTSPVTIGYLKPMILLPVAALNQLSTTQVEAILLHELSHIRRYDYLVNLIVSIIHTLLYFNPFVKFFMNAIESERETCCDELVLQFGYDKVSYATALLHLEKASGKYKSLILAAAGKQNLLTRIEKIVGMEKKKTFRLIQIVPLLAAVLCILLFNSVLIIKDAKNGAAMAYTNDTVFLPWHLNNTTNGRSQKNVPVMEEHIAPEQLNELTAFADPEIKIDILNFEEPALAKPEHQTNVPMAELVDHFIPVNFNDVDGSLTTEEKNNVTKTVEATKKVVSELQWKEIEASLAEVMDKKEKALAKQEYLHEVNLVNWKNIEQNLKANYDRIDWKAINQNVNKAMALVQIDSLHTVYTQALQELEMAERELKSKAKVSCTPMPDVSFDEINLAKEVLRKSIDSLKSISKPKKVIRL